MVSLLLASMLFATVPPLEQPNYVIATPAVVIEEDYSDVEEMNEEHRRRLEEPETEAPRSTSEHICSMVEYTYTEDGWDYYACVDCGAMSAEAPDDYEFDDEEIPIEWDDDEEIPEEDEWQPEPGIDYYNDEEGGELL